MTFNYNIIADLHTHTIASGHSFNTITEMVSKAKELNLRAIAITEHSMLMPGGAHPWHFNNMVRLPQILDNLLVLKGAEANVCDEFGKLDFTNDDFEQLNFDWVIASIHQNIFKPNTPECTLNTWLNIAKNPYVDMIGHCEQFTCDFEQIVKAFKENNKIVEINAASSVARPGKEQNMLALIRACKNNNAYIAINSDSHSVYTLANIDSVTQLLAQEDFPHHLIINSNVDLLRQILITHNKKAATAL